MKLRDLWKMSTRVCEEEKKSVGHTRDGVEKKIKNKEENHTRDGVEKKRKVWDTPEMVWKRRKDR